ncbi:MAG: LuxR C-terminal-related transcriptional regulator [Tannerellaceae bacterium]|nr:LuxR C-terminal-related transcriptional regulator [Tannerellaceae bacterium]
MTSTLKIAIAESSLLLRSGLEAQLKRLAEFKIQLVEIITTESLFESLRMHKPDLVIINPAFPGTFTPQQIKEECGCQEMKCIALLYSMSDPAQLRLYDEQITIFDGLNDIKNKLEGLLVSTIQKETESEDAQTLSTREKEIVVCVVKGMTNRKIADQLFLSTHTVITHRRNIARKLQIHSASGLTVYAIVNKLIELEDIQQKIG